MYACCHMSHLLILVTDNSIKEGKAVTLPNQTRGGIFFGALWRDRGSFYVRACLTLVKI